MLDAFAQTVEPMPEEAGPEAVEELAQAPPDTVGEAVRIDSSFALAKVEASVVGFQRMLPNLTVALLLLLAFAGIGWAVQRTLLV